MLKEFYFHINLGESNYREKMRHAEKFLRNGTTGKLTLKIRGREMIHPEIGMNLIRRMHADLGHTGSADHEPKLIGKYISLILSPLSTPPAEKKF
ncbi:MAG TPA: translation initiation factor IF-3 C-terminal domain-containing protein [Candidatus Methylacidiphilales bacterium]|nr:translation initiation factor IF-3 C-terminal domain-containing protein [Candidatus Methylacidiphilales bacterium]